VFRQVKKNQDDDDISGTLKTDAAAKVACSMNCNTQKLMSVPIKRVNRRVAS
jgi:hypothetical protein